jgi:pyruvate-formate lyase-activating enzyme
MLLLSFGHMCPEGIKDRNGNWRTDSLVRYLYMPVLSGFRGSGTVFFSNCNLRCRYCQNWQLSS